ncbi:MAG: BON domain-containing protein [Lactobacillales bacterium]|jgi:osmotically-inducible protein OsmY|nr:BON domain-containing protein [Lactobacillales bacterium]
MKNTFFYAILISFSLMTAGCGYVFGPFQDERSFSEYRSDAAITASIKSKLMGEKISKTFDVSVYCFDGNVYLVGAADNTFRQRAEGIAHKEEGVKSVTAKWFPVGASSVNDVALAAKINAILLGTSNVTSNQVSVEVIGGNVVLLGKMYGPEEIDRTLSAVRNTKGVKTITNYLIAAY